MRQKGDILEASDRRITAGKHYIIYLEGYDENNFIGGMLTHSQSDKNVLMEESHFLTEDENNNIYQFQFDRTNLVIAKLMKFESWGPFTKVGQLTAKGIAFVDQIIGDLLSETWEEYLARTA